MVVELTAFLPLKNFVFRFPEFPKDYRDCLRDFVESAPGILRRRVPRMESIELRILPESSPAPKSLGYLNSVFPFRREDYDILEFNVSYNIDVNEVLNLNKDNPIDEASIPILWASILPGEIEDLLLLASLAYPGRFHSDVGQVFLEGRGYNSIKAPPGLPIDTFLTTCPPPSVSIVPLSQIDRWENSLGLFAKRVGDTPVKRAFVSFTHLQYIEAWDYYTRLFYSMQGLEAFYCKGDRGMKKQLVEKAGMFLNLSGGSDIPLGELYKLRSRFVHGDFPTLLPGSDWGDEDWYSQAEELSEASSFAVRLLTASLQRCAREGSISVEFG